MDFPKTVDQVPQSEIHPKNNKSQPNPTNPNRKKITLKGSECRCLLAQLKKLENRDQAQFAVAELFSPPRFTVEAQNRGDQGIAFDKKQGWDLMDRATQQKVDRLLDELRPELLVVCPPCTHAGGWEHLNACYRTPLERALLIKANKDRLRFSRQQIEKQVRRGGEFLFEHPWGADTWGDPEFKQLKRKYGVVKTDMCQHGLKCPDSNLPIRKSTGLMASRSLARHVGQCDGSHEHRRIEGKLKSGQLVSDFCAKYTHDFVRNMYDALIDTRCETDVAHFVEAELVCLAADERPPADAVDEHQGSEQPNRVDSDLKKTVFKLRQNLGHPSNEQLIRVLRNSRASPEAIACAKDLECTVCMNHKAPAPALPANVPNPLAFNDHIGLDVKHVSSWKAGQRVPCINIVDYGTSFQIMVPIYVKESSELIKQVLQDSWISWAGPPKVLSVDPAQPNISQAVSEFCEAHGISLQPTAGEAHWQSGKVERHGGWFSQILDKVLEDVGPASQSEFVECVVQTQCAKNSLINVTGTTPYQLVFGRNPRIPTDLLQDDPDIGACEHVVLQDEYARANQIRHNARMAVLACQDSQALRAALRARPRTAKPFQSGQWVYYWRSQKWIQGKLIRGGQWCGAGMLLGQIGRNWVVAHRKNLIRCAPEQLRHATAEERVVADDVPSNELLGIKNLLERGQFPKSQFEDIVPLDNPPHADRADEAIQQVVRRPATAGELVQQAQSPLPTIPEESGVPMSLDTSSGSNSTIPSTENSGMKTQEYGPVRRRYHCKSSQDPLIRPDGGMFEDFQEMMQSLVPAMIPGESSSSSGNVPSSEPVIPPSPRTSSHKRGQ